MKKIVLSVCAFLLAGIAIAQPGKIAKSPAPVLKNQFDSASYAIGMSVASFYKQQGITKLNPAMVNKGMNDEFAGTKPVIDHALANDVLSRYLNSLAEQKAKVNIEEGRKFLEQNKTKPGVHTTASGLQYEVITEGTGPKPTALDSVTCHYKGTLLNGTEVDNSYSRGAPITFSLNGVIAGWTEGIQLMSVGSKYRLWIPYNLAYGPSGYSSIPGGATLYFEVELLDVKKNQ